jgi:hypothetical protein
MNQPNDVKKPKSRKQITSTLVYMCTLCMEDLKSIQYVENISGEFFIRTKHVCISKQNCNFEYIE